jgi:hypothetical protein
MTLMGVDGRLAIPALAGNYPSRPLGRTIVLRRGASGRRLIGTLLRTGVIHTAVAVA